MSSYKKISFIIITIFLTFGLSLSLQSLLASWTPPTAIAPTNNASEPINRSGLGQDKIGGLVLNSGSMTGNGLVVKNGNALVSNGGLEVDDEIRVGNSGVICTTTNSGAIRYNSISQILEFCNGLIWKNLSNTPTQICFIANGGGTQEWNGTSWDTCIVSGCNAGYHIDGNACVSDTKSCVVANGVGAQTWDGTTWGPCTTVSCNSGYELLAGGCQKSIVWLFGHIHTTTDCEAYGVDWVDGGGNHFCRVNGSSCATGWTRYGNWSATTAGSCNSGATGCGCIGYCSTSNHSWSDYPIIETCGYGTGRACRECIGATCSATISELGCY